jgi:hypothetical protein
MIYIPEVPNNSLKNELEEIVFLANAAVNSDVYEEELLTFKFNKPVTESELVSFEKEVNVEFDEEYKDFLRFSNGAVLCFSSAEFYSIKEIKSLYSKEKSDDFPEDYVIIAEVVGDGEILCFSKNTGKYYSCFEGEEEEYDSFSDCLKEILEGIREKIDECVGLDN